MEVEQAIKEFWEGKRTEVRMALCFKCGELFLNKKPMKKCKEHRVDSRNTIKHESTTRGLYTGVRGPKNRD